MIIIYDNETSVYEITIATYDKPSMIIRDKNKQKKVLNNCLSPADSRFTNLADGDPPFGDSLYAVNSVKISSLVEAILYAYFYQFIAKSCKVVCKLLENFENC